MELVIEGTLAEVQERLRTLPVTPEMPLRVIVEAVQPVRPPEQTPEKYFANAPRRNGVILVPSLGTNMAITTELVKSLLEDD